MAPTGGAMNSPLPAIGSWWTESTNSRNKIKGKEFIPLRKIDAGLRRCRLTSSARSSTASTSVRGGAWRQLSAGNGTNTSRLASLLRLLRGGCTRQQEDEDRWRPCRSCPARRRLTRTHHDSLFHQKNNTETSRACATSCWCRSRAMAMVIASPAARDATVEIRATATQHQARSSPQTGVHTSFLMSQRSSQSSSRLGEGSEGEAPLRQPWRTETS